MKGVVVHIFLLLIPIFFAIFFFLQLVFLLALYFEDFDNESLGLILKRNCKKEELKISMSVRRAVVQQLSMRRSLPNFGNAGAVESMLSEAKKKAITRIQIENKESETKTNTNGTMTLIQEDFGIGDKKDPYEALSKMFKMDKFITHFKDIEASIQMTDSRPKLSRPSLSNYLFLGNSGTGKTTVAKCMASIFYNMGAPTGMLPTDRCLVVSAASLCGTHVGQAQEIVRKQFKEAIGGVLLIDEAYELGKSQYGEEALTTIVALLTEDDFKGKLICILAGYEKDMNQMLDTNQGARSRFASTLLFDDWDPNDCALLCVKHASDKGIQLDIKDRKISNALLKGFRDIKNRGRFANARDVENVSEMIFKAYSLRIYNENNTVKTTNGEEDDEEEDGDISPAYTFEDINSAVQNMLKQRPPETMEDKTAASNRTNRRGNVATKKATRNRPRFTENENQNENEISEEPDEADEEDEEDLDVDNNLFAEENEYENDFETDQKVEFAPEALQALEYFEKALTEMQYNLQNAYDVLQQIADNGTYPDDLMEKLEELTNMTESEIRAMMLPQVEQLAERHKEILEEQQRQHEATERLDTALKEIAEEKERIRLEEEKRQKELEAALKKKREMELALKKQQELEERQRKALEAARQRQRELEAEQKRQRELEEKRRKKLEAELKQKKAEEKRRVQKALEKLKKEREEKKKTTRSRSQTSTRRGKKSE